MHIEDLMSNEIVWFYPQTPKLALNESHPNQTLSRLTECTVYTKKMHTLNISQSFYFALEGLKESVNGDFCTRATLKDEG